MKKYLIVEQNSHLLAIVSEHDTRKDAVEWAKTLPMGTYSLLSVLRPEFEVRESVRISTPVINWGPTRQPRKRRVNTTTNVGE